MINKSKDFKVYKNNIEYQDGECWDLLGYHWVSYNTIVAKGTNFIKSVIEKDKWETKEDTVVIEQNDNETTMKVDCYTTYYTRYTENPHLELDMTQYITIKHNKPLSQIKKEYEEENNLFNSLKDILLQKGYKETTYKCYKCNECIGCISRKRKQTKYQRFTMTKQFNDKQTIKEVKKIFDDDYQEIKTLSKQFFKAETEMYLGFAEKGALGEIELKHYYK